MRQDIVLKMGQLSLILGYMHGFPLPITALLVWLGHILLQYC